MKVERVRAGGLWAMVAVTAIAWTGCASGGRPSAPQGSGAIEAQTAGAKQRPALDHVQPARDSSGPVPPRLVWTTVAGADTYSVGIWNEVDRLMWRQDGIAGTSTPGPTTSELEPGTYFWTISALRGGDEIANSGLAAFVVRAAP